MTINWTQTRAEQDLINRIVLRAISKLPDLDRMELAMDLAAVHCNGNPLDLAAFLHGGDFDFAHDITGIVRHIDRTTGKLGDCFLPRFSSPHSRPGGAVAR